ncbi:hypothetical protein Bca4012_038958 [Brassica carinata]
MNVSESEDLGPVITQANKRSKTLTPEPEGNSCLIPCDLIIEILLRLPAKSIARCRRVTKRWASLLRLPYFTELFLTKSSTCPRLLLACEKNGHLLFFSSPQPQSSFLLTTSYYHMRVPDNCHSCEVRISCIKGLVLLRFEHVLNAHGNSQGHVSVICNPSTGQSLILPKVKTRRRIGVRSYLGYDPVEKQYKVLSMTWLFHGGQWLASEEHQVLTLGGKEPSWRKIECSVPHTINYKYHNVCIDVQFCYDTDSYTQYFQCAVLKNYNGKLASLGPETINGGSRSIRLRVLEDVKKGEWSQHTYILPNLWRNIPGAVTISFVGVTRRKEIVFSSSFFQCLLYFDTKRSTVVKVGIQGIKAVKNRRMFVFQDYVEDVKLMWRDKNSRRNDCYTAESCGRWFTCYCNCKVEAEERRTNLRLREEQDAAYRTALEADQEEDEERLEREAAEAERKRKEEEEEDTSERAEREAARGRMRQDKALALGDEPGKGPDVTQVLIRFPNGERKRRRFESNTKVQTLYAYVDSLGVLQTEEYSLITNFPRTVSGRDKESMSLKDAGLHPQASFFIEIKFHILLFLSP